MSLETIAEKGIPLLRDFTRWFSWDRVSQRCRSWTVLEWLEPYDAVIKFGDPSIASRVVATRVALATCGYPNTEEQRTHYDPLKLRADLETSVLLTNIIPFLLNGSLVAKGYRNPMVHGAPYLPIARSEWLILQLDIDRSSAEGEGIKYVGMTIGKSGTKRFFQRCRPGIS